MCGNPRKRRRSPCPLGCMPRLGKAAPRAIVHAAFRCNSRARLGSLRRDGRALRTKLVWWSALPMLAVVPAVATAQIQPAPVPSAAGTTANQIVDFSADTVTYDSDTDVVTASGEVRMNREG